MGAPKLPVMRLSDWYPLSGLSAASVQIQRGFPRLPPPGSTTQALLFKAWLSHCDAHHSCHQKGIYSPPTRLIDVGDSETASILRLDCTPRQQCNKYVALSYLWGDEDKHPRFCTTTATCGKHEKSIDYDTLPKTYRDAVNITRSLGIRYLWIDSLCILQGPDGDFEVESKKMEDVFSGAYVTLAARCATGTSDGFLKDRPTTGPKARTCHALSTGAQNSTFYVCNAIDNFMRDVEEGELSTRGWVYQERALSTRTIHFTETQTYWECGQETRCETLAKMPG